MTAECSYQRTKEDYIIHFILVRRYDIHYSPLGTDAMSCTQLVSLFPLLISKEMLLLAPKGILLTIYMISWFWSTILQFNNERGEGSAGMGNYIIKQ